MNPVQKLAMGMAGKGAKKRLHHPSMPVTPEDKKISIRHLKETIKFHDTHAKEHMVLAKRTPDKGSKKYNVSHAKEHLQNKKEAEKSLKKRYK